MLCHLLPVPERPRLVQTSLRQALCTKGIALFSVPCVRFRCVLLGGGGWHYVELHPCVEAIAIISCIMQSRPGMPRSKQVVLVGPGRLQSDSVWQQSFPMDELRLSASSVQLAAATADSRGPFSSPISTIPCDVRCSGSLGWRVLLRL